MGRGMMIRGEELGRRTKKFHLLESRIKEFSRNLILDVTVCLCVRVQGIQLSSQERKGKPLIFTRLETHGHFHLGKIKAFNQES